MTDTYGRLLAVEVYPADIHYSDGAKGVLKRSRARVPFVENVYADDGCSGRLVQCAQNKTHVALEIVKCPPGAKGFVVIRHRWVGRRAHLRVDHEMPTPRARPRATHSDADNFITIAAIATFVRRAA